MLIMETKNKLNYEVTSQEAYVNQFYFNINFIVDGKEYIASCTYYNGDMLTDYLIQDDNGWGVEDEDINALGRYLLDNMEINKDTITW